jgi:hypothetical protein
MLGFFKAQGAVWNTQSIPQDFSFGEIQPDWDRMVGGCLVGGWRAFTNGRTAMERKREAWLAARSPIHTVSSLTGSHIPRLASPCRFGFTVDSVPRGSHDTRALGAKGRDQVSLLRTRVLQTRQRTDRGGGTVPAQLLCRGGNELGGILTGGGVGRILAHWILDGHPPSGVDVTGIHANRFYPHQCNEECRSQRVAEALENTCRVSYPDHQPQTCRGAKLSVLHGRLRQSANAYYRNVT